MSRTDGLAKAFVAKAAVPKYSIVRFSATDGQVEVATADSNSLIGVSGETDTAAGEVADIFMTGIQDIELAGTANQGNLVTTNASGKAVAVTPGAGVNSIGYLLQGGVSGDIVPMLVNRTVYSA